MTPQYITLIYPDHYGMKNAKNMDLVGKTSKGPGKGAYYWEIKLPKSHAPPIHLQYVQNAYV